MTVSQQRVLRTAIPGPRSVELQARKAAAVATGVGTTLPIYVTAAGGGIVVDVDGNQLIDFGSGIAVTSIGNAAPRVVSAVQAQVADFTHTCFMVTPCEECIAVGTSRPTRSTCYGSSDSTSQWSILRVFRRGAPMPPPTTGTHSHPAYEFRRPASGQTLVRFASRVH